MSVLRRLSRCVLPTVSALGTAALGWGIPAACDAAPDGWTQTWSDEFNGATLDTSKWTAWQPSTDGPYNNEKQEYLPQQVAVNGGNLVITGTNQPYSSQYGSYAYRSGRIEGKYNQHYGRFEIRADLPGTKGTWPALWLLPNANWPTQGEIDILENKGDQPTVTSSAFHFQLNGNHQYVTAERSSARFGTVENYHNSFHTYAVEWDDEKIRYFVDDVHWYTTYNDGNYAGQGGTTVQNFLANQTAGMHVVLNLAIGGDFLGGAQPDGTSVWPQQLLVDYVRIFQRDNSPLKLANGDFEQNSGSLAQWSLIGNRTGTNNVSVHNQAAEGLASLKVFGQFTGSTNTSGASQGITVAPGDQVKASVDYFIRSQDSITGTANTGIVRIEFFDEFGARTGSADMLSTADATIATGATPNDAWQNYTNTWIAPANAVEARLSLLLRQVSNGGGAIHFDNVSFVNASLAASADFNLDGTVDADDLALWQANFGLETGAVRATGDANGDGAVDGADLIQWQQQSQHGAAEATSTAAAVPEPATGAWAACAAAVAFLRSAVRAPASR